VALAERWQSMRMSDLCAVVLAAGQGKRMQSNLTKVLHPIAGRPLVYYPVRAAVDAGATRIVVVTSREHHAEVDGYLGRTFGSALTRCVVQDPPRGTGDAARVGIEGLEAERVLILYGDTPLLKKEDLVGLLASLEKDSRRSLALMTALVDDPRGYGRVLRGADGQVREVREDRDLENDEQRSVREVNAGVYAARTEFLKDAVARLTPGNAQGEYYLSDVVATARESGGASAVLGDPQALAGVNDRAQLVAAEDLMYARIAQRHAHAGVTVRAGARIEESVEIEPDATIEAGVILRGASHVGAGTQIDVGCVISDSRVGRNARLKPYSVVSESSVGDGAQIGPFAHLRPGSRIDEEAHVGNFVETKKTHMRRGSKANHLAYLGDGEIGEAANVGAGTIFCNYDGFRKHKTIIGDRAFIGSDSQIVAPVRIGNDAYVATGTTVTRDVPDEALAIARTKQENKTGYAPRLKARLKAGAPKPKDG
jgi:bifunctional UDP-N-acetylglucosamine pyrophosphorylase / glucosamine-1-phosphate N-acetyltransferase